MKTTPISILRATSVQDYANRVIARSASIRVRNYIPDVTGPRLVDFVINPTSESIRITFDEAVNVTTFETLLTEIMSTINTTTILLTDSTAAAVPGQPHVVDIMLGRVDVTTLTNAAPDSMLLRIRNVTVFDYDGNRNQPVGDISGGTGQVVDTFAPQLVLVEYNANNVESH